MAKLLSVKTVLESRSPVTVDARKLFFLQAGTTIVSAINTRDTANSLENVKIVQTFAPLAAQKKLGLRPFSEVVWGIRLVCWACLWVAEIRFGDGLHHDCSEASGDRASYRGDCFFILIFKQLEWFAKSF